MKALLALLIFSLVASSSWANDLMPDYGWNEAAEYYGVNADLLKAISLVESTCKAVTVQKNKNGSEDHGHMQINSFWKKHLGESAWRYLNQNPCFATMVGAWILKYEIQRHGYNWNAVCAYHMGKSLPELERDAQADPSRKWAYEKGKKYVEQVKAALEKLQAGKI